MQADGTGLGLTKMSAGVGVAVVMHIKENYQPYLSAKSFQIFNVCKSGHKDICLKYNFGPKLDRSPKLF